MAISGSSAGSNFATMKLKPHHYIIAGVIVALILLGTGFGLGRNSKQCPVYPSTSILSDSIRLQFEEAYLQKERDLRDIYIFKEDSLKYALKKRPTKQQVRDEITYLRSLPLDSALLILRTTPSTGDEE